MELIDTHNHIDLAVFFDDFQYVLESARAVGVVSQILPGVYRDGWKRILNLSETEAGLYAAIGLHPMYLQHHSASDLVELQGHATRGRLVAIGEIGLDYFVKNTNHRAQQELFQAQLIIAAKSKLPVLLHVRKAHDQVQAILRKMHFKNGGIVHAFSGSMQQAVQYVKLGFFISVCGTVSYDRATRIRGVVGELPLDSLVLETDSPDIPPAVHYGQRNSPEYLPVILSALAELRGEPQELIAKQTTANARNLLSLKGA
jgi:TatD DNase family protein